MNLTKVYLLGGNFRKYIMVGFHKSLMCKYFFDYTHTHTHPFNCPFSRTTRVSRYQKGKTNLDFTAARDSEWQWHQLGHNMQVCTSLQTDNHANTPPLCFLQAGCPSCRPTNSVKAPKGLVHKNSFFLNFDYTRHIVYRPRSRQPNNVIKCTSAAWLGSFAH